MHENRRGKNSKTVADKLKGKFATLHAQMRELAEDKKQITLLLERLCKLKQIHATEGTPSRCEKCQQPFWGPQLLRCTPSAGMWETWQSLLFYQKCAPS